MTSHVYRDLKYYYDSSIVLTHFGLIDIKTQNIKI